MRKHQHRQILEILQTLKDAAVEIERYIFQKDLASAVQMLSDCQECAVQIGECIERSEGEGTKTVALLEQYCDNLYQISVEMEMSDANHVKKRLDILLSTIENSVKKDLMPNKLEIVFICYKASMSDSIESFYLAAKADLACDPVFLPVPYYEMNPDRSFGKMRYEGREYYGDNIEITDWREYDVEAQRPDVIVTFAPYDEGNLVTTIHPDYYVKRLRKFTDCLVYVPYFVISGDEIQEHLVTLAGCIYSDFVFVQSEGLKRSYIENFLNAFGKNFGNPNKRFISMGSCKFDKVINTKRENVDIPENWRQMIGGRKVVLYNTSLGVILYWNEAYIKKLRCVLATFKEYGDICLLWRPHPLSEATFASMRPHLAAEYSAIVANYKAERCGIYDDSADLHRSIAISDAYYGDWSSVVALYGITGKPAVIQNVGIECCVSVEKLFGLLPESAKVVLNFRDYITADSELLSFSLDVDGIVYGQREAFGQLTKYPDGSAGVHMLEFIKNIKSR